MQPVLGWMGPGNPRTLTDCHCSSLPDAISPQKQSSCKAVLILATTSSMIPVLISQRSTPRIQSWDRWGRLSTELRPGWLWVQHSSGSSSWHLPSPNTTSLGEQELKPYLIRVTAQGRRLLSQEGHCFRLHLTSLRAVPQEPCKKGCHSISGSYGDRGEGATVHRFAPRGRCWAFVEADRPPLACCPISFASHYTHTCPFLQTGWVQITPLPLTTSLGKLLNAFAPQCSYLKTGDNNYTYLQSCVVWSWGPYPITLIQQAQWITFWKITAPKDVLWPTYHFLAVGGEHPY